MIIITRREIKGLLRVAAEQDTRYYLNGIYFDPAGYAVVTDGCILMALRVNAFEGAGFIAPRDALKTVVQKAKKADTPVRIARDIGPDMFTMEYQAKEPLDYTHVFKAIDGKYPEWRRVILEPSGEPAEDFCPELRCRIIDAVNDIEDKTDAGCWLTPNGTNRAGVMKTLNPRILAIVMPRDLSKKSALGQFDAKAHIAQFFKPRNEDLA